MKKYELTEQTIVFNNVTLYRIRAINDFSDVSNGDLGGFVENEGNLSQEGYAWVYNNAKVYGNARVYGDAEVYNGAMVYGNAKVYGDAKVYGEALVCGNAEVFGNAEVCGNADVRMNGDYIVFKNWWSSGRYFTWTRSNNMWKVGCFLGTGKQLTERARKDGPVTYREYKRVVNYVESILED